MQRENCEGRTGSQQAGARYAMPRQRKDVVARPRLLSRLHAGVGNGITVLQAPAGYGKTTLLTSFSGELDYEVRWISLDATCGSPEVFAEQLAAALAGGTRTAGRPAVATKPADLQAFVAASVRDETAKHDRPLWLVIDNVHELAESHTSTAMLEWLMFCLPEGAELVLCGREMPLLPDLDERIATGDCLALGRDDLAFDLEEIERAVPPTVSPKEILAATDGWPVGVMAMLASGQVGAAARGGTLNSAAFDRYLSTQVWAGVAEDLKPALLRLSVLPVISKAYVVAELGADVWTLLDRWIGARNFLCETLPGPSLRLNPLLRQFLRAEFERSDPEAHAEACEQVVVCLVKTGHVNEAIETARAGGQTATLAQLLEDHSGALILEGSFSSLWRAFECLPPEMTQERPLLRAVWARLLSHLGNPEEALTRSDAILSEPGIRGAARIHALLARFRSLRLTGQREELLRSVAALRSVEICDDRPVLCELTFTLAEIELSVTRDFEKANRLLRETIAACEEAHVEPLGLLARSTLGQQLAMKGDAPEAVTVLTKAAAGWRKVGRSSNLGWVLNNLGMSHLQVGDFESAATVLKEARQEGVLCGNPRNVAYAIASLAEAEHALGNYQQAREGYEEAIRICAEDAPDETLAALSIAGLAGALLCLGDVQQADFFSRRALLVAIASSNSYELAFCKLQQAAVESVAGNHVVAITEAAEAVALFEKMDAKQSLCVAYYRQAMAYFRANRRPEAQEVLRKLDAIITQPWIASVLIPLLREHPMFAQWAASRNLAGRAFREMIERQSFESEGDAKPVSQEPTQRFPNVVAKSLGSVSVAVGGRDVTDEAWSSVRAKELFFLLLANRGGLRKETAVEHLYPEISPEKCNSAFHSNLYRVRKALFQDSVVKRDGTYLLNPEGNFDWDLDRFNEAIARAQSLPAGSQERATAFQEAIALYDGPFAEAFESEWAQSMRAAAQSQAHESLSMLAGYFAGREDYESAALCMERVLKANRFNEEAAYQLARFRTQAGNPVAALAFMDEYRSAYEEELGSALPARFGTLRAQIAAGAVG